MEIYIPSELDNETYLKYEKIIKINNISTIYLIKDKYDIKENTYIGDDTSKIYVTKSLINTLPINEYFSIICMSKPNESCKTYKLLTLNKLLDEYNTINEIKESINNFNKDNNDKVSEDNFDKVEFHNYGNEEENYLSQELDEDLEELSEINNDEFNEDEEEE